MEIIRPNACIQIIDEASFAALAAQTAVDPAYHEDFRSRIMDGRMAILGLAEDGKYVGRVNLWLPPADEQAVKENFPGVPLVTSLHVNEEVRGNGYGVMLMEALHTEAVRRGFDRIGLGVEPGNQVARQLYEKLGYDYQKPGGADTYEVSWNETSSGGEITRVSVSALFMLKQL